MAASESPGRGMGRASSKKKEKKTRKAPRAAAASSPPESGTPSPAVKQEAVRDRIAGMLALGVLVAVSYAPAVLWGGFVWDDRVITEAPPIRDAGGLWSIWFSPSDLEFWEGHYWPLVYTTFWLEHKLWGFAPTGYHAVNVLLHAVNTVLLWGLLLRLAVPGAWIVAAVFAVHPLHVESVAWVLERKDVLSALFYLAAFRTWVRFGEAPHARGRTRRYVLTLTLFGLGMLSKSVVVTLPAALLIGQWWQRDRVTGADMVRLAPFFVVGAAIAAADTAFYRSKEVVSFDYSLVERVQIAAHALWFYVGKLLWPIDLAVIYPHWEVGVADPLAWGYFVAALAAAAALWFLQGRVGRGPLAGALFFAVTLSPVLGFVDFGYMQFSFVADRYQYLAGIGVIAVVVGSAAYWGGRLPGRMQWGAAGTVAVVLLILGTLTWRQAGIYRDNVTFYTHILAHNPTARSAQYNLGNALITAQRPEEALAAFRIAAAQQPDSVDAHSNTGRAFMDLNRLDEAAERLQYALKMDPRHTVSLQNLALVRIRQQRHEEALDIYGRLLDIDPRHVGGHSGMGIALHYLGRTDEAMQSVDRALALDQTYAEALVNRELMPQVRAHADAGLARMKQGRLDEAEQHLRYVRQIDPAYTPALQNLALLQLRRQRYAEALALYRRLVEMNPDHAEAHSGMGVALYYLDRVEDALESLDRALALDPTLEEARANRDAMRQSLQPSGP